MYGIIYCIENKINGHKYIGQTIQSLQTRYADHWREYNKQPDRNFPLDLAFKKYGYDNFICYQIDEANDWKELDNKEIYWIAYYNTYLGNGYNATLGGKGCPKYNLPEAEIIELYQECHNSGTIAEIYGVSQPTILLILHKNNIVVDSNYSKKKAVACYKDEQLIRCFESSLSAADWIIEQKLSSAQKSSIGKSIRRASDPNSNYYKFAAYGFKWRRI